MEVCKRFGKMFIAVLLMVMVLSVFFISEVSNVNTVYAVNSIEDSVGGSNESQNSQSSSQSSQGGNTIFDDIADEELGENDEAFSNWLSSQGGLTSDQLETASNTMSPITTLIGYITGAVVVLLMALLTLMTALDLLYITVPPIRNILCKQPQAGGAMGGMSGGFGGFGGFGRQMRGAMGSNGAAQPKATQWVSDEAVACVSLLGSSQQNNAGMGSMGGMNMQGNQQQSTKSVIFMYFRKRLFFILLLAICLIVLTSSIVLNCGINLGQWLLKLISMFNGRIS